MPLQPPHNLMFLPFLEGLRGGALPPHCPPHQGPPPPPPSSCGPPGIPPMSPPQEGHPSLPKMPPTSVPATVSNRLCFYVVFS